VTGPLDTPDGEVAEVAEEDVALQGRAPRDAAGDDPADPDAAPDTGGTGDLAGTVLIGDVIVADDDPLAAAVAERDEYLDALRRLQAEFENYKKRVAKLQSEQSDRAARSLAESLLPVLDALDLAAEHSADATTDDAKALLAASGLLNDTLAKAGLERIEADGAEFDPTAHEAVGHAPAGESDPTGADGADHETTVVAQVMRPGYRWRGTVVRPAMVLVRG
jgi:molecular chaperone GrpE